MRIALVSIEYPPDPYSAGIGSYTQILARALTSRGHSVQVITRGEKDSISNEAGIIVHRLTPSRPNLPTNFNLLNLPFFIAKVFFKESYYRQRIAKRLEQIIKQDGLDLIESSDYMAEAVFYKARHAQIPFIVRLHTPFAYAERIEKHVPEVGRLAMRALEKRMLNKASHITAPSQVSAERFAEELALGERPIKVIANPSSLGLKLTNQELQETEQDKHTVLFVGRMNKWKGTHILAQAIPLIIAQLPQTRFVFVGADLYAIDKYSSMAEYLLSLVPSNYHDRITFTGYVIHKEVAYYLTSATVCVFPSLFEAFGYTCLEAMTYSKAIVGSKEGGMVEMLAGGEVGRLYSPPNHEELAEHIVELLSDANLRKSLGEKARARVLEHYDQNIIVSKIINYYQQAIKELQES